MSMAGVLQSGPPELEAVKYGRTILEADLIR